MLFLLASKDMNLNASTGNLFRSLYNQYKEWDGLDIPLEGNPGSVVDITVTDDSIEVKLQENSTVLSSFEAYYIEDDEYGDPVYDIYVNDYTEEDVDKNTVEDEIAAWFRKLRHNLYITDEESEDRFFENRTIDPGLSLDKRRKEIIDENFDSSGAIGANHHIPPLLRQAIGVDEMRKVCFPLLKVEVEDQLYKSCNNQFYTLGECSYTVSKDKPIFLADYTIFDRPYVIKAVMDEQLEHYFYEIIFHDKSDNTLDNVISYAASSCYSDLIYKIHRTASRLWGNVISRTLDLNNVSVKKASMSSPSDSHSEGIVTVVIKRSDILNLPENIAEQLKYTPGVLFGGGGALITDKTEIKNFLSLRAKKGIVGNYIFKSGVFLSVLRSLYINAREDPDSYSIRFDFDICK